MLSVYLFILKFGLFFWPQMNSSGQNTMKMALTGSQYIFSWNSFLVFWVPNCMFSLPNQRCEKRCSKNYCPHIRRARRRDWPKRRTNWLFGRADGPRSPIWIKFWENSLTRQKHSMERSRENYGKFASYTYSSQLFDLHTNPLIF